MDWARILAYLAEMTDQELLARNEYLAAESRIMRRRWKVDSSCRTPRRKYRPAEPRQDWCSTR